MEGSSEVSGSGLAITPGTDHHDPHLPGYFPFLSLAFKWIATLILVLMACCVVYTIKTTRSLHKPHNIFVANMLVTDIISAMLTTVPPSMMIIGYATGVGDFINCRLMQFLVLPVFVLYCTYLMIAVNQVIAIAFPFKHKKIMKRRVIVGSIVAAWFVSVLLNSHVFFNAGYTKIAQYGVCLSEGSTFVFTFLGFILPNYIVSLVTLCFNIFLAVKAYRIQKKIREESRLSGTTSNEVQKLKKKQATIKTHMKPMITLLLVIFCSSALGLIYPLVYMLSRVLETAEYVDDMMDYVISRNVGYLVILLHPFVYGLYYKQVREPMMKVLKQAICKNKFNSVAPQP